jgi:hypothetical protein
MLSTGLVRFAERWTGSLAYQVGSVEALQDALDYAWESAVRAGLCQAPRAGEDLSEYAEVVGAYAGVGAKRLLAIVQQIVAQTEA